MNLNFVTILAFVSSMAQAQDKIICKGEGNSTATISFSAGTIEFANSSNNPLEGAYRITYVKDRFSGGYIWQHTYSLDVPYALILSAPNNGDESTAKLITKQGNTIVDYHRCD